PRRETRPTTPPAAPLPARPDVETPACIAPAAPTCSGGAIALSLQYTGAPLTDAGGIVVTIKGSQAAAITHTYTVTTLDSSTNLTSAGENGFGLDATAHGQTKLGGKTTVTIFLNTSGEAFTEIFRTDCSCTANPSVNLVVGGQMCLDSGSPDNMPSLICTGPGTPDSCCSDFDAGTCKAGAPDHVCTGVKTPLFCCKGADSYAACKGAVAPLFKLTALKDPKFTFPPPGASPCADTLPANGCADVTYKYTITNSGPTTAT